MALFHTVHLVLSGTTQKVYAYPEEWPLGIPSSGSARVYKGEKSMDDSAEFSPTVTIDSTSTTVTVSAGPAESDPRKLYVASVAGMDPGVSYLAENGDEQRELITPMRLNVASGFLVLENELRYPHNTSSTVKGVRMEFTVDSDWVSNSNNILLPGIPSYRAVWTFNVASVTRRAYTYLRLVRKLPKHGLDLRDLQKYWPDIVNEDPKSFKGQRFTHLLDAAWDDFKRDLMAVGREPSQIDDQETVSGCVLKKALHLAALYHGIHPGAWTLGEYEGLARKEYETEFAKHFGGTTTVKVMDSTAGNASTTTRHNMWFRG